MRQRTSFQAKNWESLEGRQLLTGASASMLPNLGFLLAQFNRNYVATPAPTPAPAPTPTPAPGGTSTGSGNSQPQILIPPTNVPPGFLDVQVKLNRADVNQLDSAADTFGDSYTGGQDVARDNAAVASFRTSLAAFDKTVSAENHLPAGSTSNLISPLLNGVPMTKNEVNNLEYVIDVFQASEGYNRDGTANNPAVLNAFQSSLTMLISNHPKPPTFPRK